MSTTNSSPQQRRQVGRVAPCRTRQEDQVPPKWLSRPARPSMRHLLNLERSARPRRADDISPLHSPLLALTTGSGRSQRQLERVVENLKLRNTGTYVHPTVATVESHGPQLRHAVAQSILDLLIEHRLNSTTVRSTTRVVVCRVGLSSDFTVECLHSRSTESQRRLGQQRRLCHGKVESHGPQLRNGGLASGAGRKIDQSFRVKPKKTCNNCGWVRGPSGGKHMIGPSSHRRLCGYYTKK